MELSFSREEVEFRAEVKAFLQTHVPVKAAKRVSLGLPVKREDVVEWQKILYNKGWGAAAWPIEFGGTGWTATQQFIFEEECALANTPLQPAFGLKMVAPVIMAFGTTSQKAYYLPKIISGEDWWCQGYSEPGSGSDLASLKTQAQRVGQNYVVNGQKTWTTLAQYANMIFCLVRTNLDARKQEGISFLLIDMKSPGVSVRPITMLDGEHEINEVWFDNVKVPVENLVGEENKGWTYAKYLLAHERTNIAQVGKSKRELKSLLTIASQHDGAGRRLIEDSRFRDQIAKLEIELNALEITNLRVISDYKKGGIGPKASLLKIKGAEIQQQLTELKMQVLGPYSAAHIREGLEIDWKKPDGLVGYPEYGPALSGTYFNYRKTTIYGGSNEIQRNIISKMMLEL